MFYSVTENHFKMAVLQVSKNFNFFKSYVSNLTQEGTFHLYQILTKPKRSAKFY